ncbi:grainyhead-like [Apophysomyces ossiformis]|uniref:Grainyhead-like n=1 Tax=Apophysomyces ossiformis TaxID=679940 RepID=A0A8H7BUM9_9FUNG|nr:grainyhead-like [Apophysomyces ossiformis]
MLVNSYNPVFSPYMDGSTVYRSEPPLTGSFIRQSLMPTTSQQHLPLETTSYPLMSAIQQPALYSTTTTTPYTSTSSNPMAMVPSPPTSCPSSINLRYDIALEAPPAAAQKADESPLTYLNKGQYYTIHLRDTEHFDGDILSTVAIMFHDESHRKSAGNYWRFWLGQQQDPLARAIDMDDNRSTGIHHVESKAFDRISFMWNGKTGASIQVRFNCLSTDFSRIKGVKGIPLRLHVESHVPSEAYYSVESTFTKIKLFRDKGAERKNKDDAKHIEKQLEKLRGKHGEPHPLWLTYTQTKPYTIFTEIPSSPLLCTIPSNPMLLPQETTVPSMTNTTTGLKRARQSSHSPTQQTSALSFPTSPCFGYNAVDVDPAYVPQPRRRIAKLSLFARFPSSDVHRAIYLDHLTADDLIEKLASKMRLARPVKEIHRQVVNKNNLVVRVDDAVVADMTEEQDMVIEVKTNEEDDTITLVLRY